jgi:hypothetical protein
MALSVKTPLGILASLVLATGAVAQLAPGVNLAAPDSAGWIKIFRGIQDTGNFYRYMGSTRVVPAQNKQHFLGTNPASPSAPFTVLAGDTIRSSGSPNGHLIFKQSLSHFRVSYQIKWPGNIGNAGLLMKVQENDTAQSQGFPRSVECQGDPNQGVGQIWALGSIRQGGSMVNGGTWVTLRASTFNHPAGWCTGSELAGRYDSTQPFINWGGEGDPCGNLIVGSPGWQYPRPAALHTGSAWRSNTDWVTVEVETHGKDTTIHYVEGQIVMKYHSPRIAPRAKPDSVIKYLTSGLMAWQSEGSNVYYRNLKVKLFPEDPLYATLYPTAVRAERTAGVGEAARPRLVFDRGFPVMLDENGRRRTLAGRRLPSERTENTIRNQSEN